MSAVLARSKIDAMAASSSAGLAWAESGADARAAKANASTACLMEHNLKV
jgi:hypothetical protein